MKYVLGVWIILSVAWWVLAIREAKRDRFVLTFPEILFMVGFMFLALPFALASVATGFVQGLWHHVRNN